MEKIEIFRIFQVVCQSTVLVRKAFLLFTLCALCACDEKNVAPNANLGSPSQTMVAEKIDFSSLSKNDFFEISNSGCMSGCPHFNLRISGDGTYTFQSLGPGKVRTPVGGEIGTKKTTELFRAIEQFRFEQISMSKIECQSFKTDQTTESMKLVISGKTYSIVYNMGCEGFANEIAIHQLEGKVSSLLQLDNLINGKK